MLNQIKNCTAFSTPSSDMSIFTALSNLFVAPPYPEDDPGRSSWPVPIRVSASGPAVNVVCVFLLFLLLLPASPPFHALPGPDQGASAVEQVSHPLAAKRPRKRPHDGPLPGLQAAGSICHVRTRGPHTGVRQGSHCHQCAHNKTGAQIQRAFYGELIEELESISPGISRNIY